MPLTSIEHLREHIKDLEAHNPDSRYLICLKQQLREWESQMKSPPADPSDQRQADISGGSIVPAPDPDPALDSREQ